MNCLGDIKTDQKVGKGRLFNLTAGDCINEENGAICRLVVDFQDVFFSSQDKDTSVWGLKMERRHPKE